ncbi:MAG: hypothetical protein JNL39_21725 [Opitutaceae bacterium]|nr:hypothetical protein [Opitutaceae bacterium]
MIPARLLLFLPFAAALHGQGTPDFEKPPISYSESKPADAVAALQKRLAAGELALAGDDRDVLRQLLAELRVPIASQTVVFSKTSLQRSRIRPEHPRVIYFSDSAYVGWVPGGLLELTVVDPRLGPIFYAMDLAALRRGVNPFSRDSDCLSCHGGAFVRDVPGVFVRSVFPADSGEPLLRHGTTVVDDQTPFADRWGGWYVTGYRGAAPHRGNAIAREEKDRLVFEPESRRPDELSAFFDVSIYPAATSDVVALLVLEHQTTLQNTLTRAAFATRRMIDYQRGLQRHFKEPESDEPTYESVRSVIASAAQDVVDRLLFHKEAELPEGVEGSAAFRAAFAADAVRTRDGRSLRDLSLRGRIFAHRCSYMIYSESFAALPPALKSGIFERLKKALDGREAKDRYAYLPAEEKERIRAVLLETLPEARARWGAAPR